MCLAPPSRAAFHVLNWHDPTLPQLPAEFASPATPIDMVLLADCTYNADSSPALVATLSALAATAPSLVVLVAMKVRHESELVFFKLMAGARFAVHRKVVLPLPMPEEDLEDEVVDVYLFRHGDGTRPIPRWAEKGMPLELLWGEMGSAV